MGQTRTRQVWELSLPCEIIAFMGREMPKSSWLYLFASCLIGWAIFGALAALTCWAASMMGRHIDTVAMLIAYGVICLLVLFRAIQIFRSTD